MKIVLDTNVFVSGIFWVGAPYQILNAWHNHKISIAVTPEILEEYTRVANILQKKHQKIDITSLMDLVTRYTEVYQPVSLPEKISCDPDDDKFIACALSSNAKIIISGDSDLLDVNGYNEITIITPRKFIDKFLK